MYYIGLDIGGTKCAVILGDENMNILKREAFATVGVNETLEMLYEKVGEIVKEYEIAGIGISCGGPLDEKKGVILSPPNLPEWDRIRITDELEKRFGIKTNLRNDANACAIAEWRFGAGRGCENMIFLTFGTGLGAGLILNGKLYSGSSAMAGEVGHIRMAEDGPVGYGKAGSLEGFCSGGGIAQLGKAAARAALECGKPLAFAKNEEEIEKITTKLLSEYAKAGDADAIAVFDKSAQKLGEGLSIMIDILNPDAIVIGSVYARSEELLRPGAMKVIEKEALSYSSSVCRILPAALGEKIGDIAALSVAMEEKL